MNASGAFYLLHRASYTGAFYSLHRASYTGAFYSLHRASYNDAYIFHIFYISDAFYKNGDGGAYTFLDDFQHYNVRYRGYYNNER
jgi:hypothetical protein